MINFVRLFQTIVKCFSVYFTKYFILLILFSYHHVVLFQQKKSFREICSYPYFIQLRTLLWILSKKFYSFSLLYTLHLTLAEFYSSPVSSVPLFLFVVRFISRLSQLFRSARPYCSSGLFTDATRHFTCSRPHDRHYWIPVRPSRDSVQVYTV